MFTSNFGLHLTNLNLHLIGLRLYVSQKAVQNYLIKSGFNKNIVIF
jgi:hypothetical protein